MTLLVPPEPGAPGAPGEPGEDLHGGSGGEGGRGGRGGIGGVGYDGFDGQRGARGRTGHSSATSFRWLAGFAAAFLLIAGLLGYLAVTQIELRNNLRDECGIRNAQLAAFIARDLALADVERRNAASPAVTQPRIRIYDAEAAALAKARVDCVRQFR